MSRATRLIPAALLILLLAEPACSMRGPEGIRRDIARSTGCTYDREFGLTLGRVGLALARLAADEGDEELRLLKDLTRVQVGVYREKGSPRVPDALELGRVRMADWQPLASIREEDGDALVLLRRKKGEVREMLVVVSDDEELTIVRLKGRLDRVLEEAARFGREKARQESGRPENRSATPFRELSTMPREFPA